MDNYKNKTKPELIAEIVRLEKLNNSLKGENITEPKNSEDELKKHKDMFELVINSVPARIFWKDLNSVYLGCNSAFAKAAGEGKIEDVIGKNDFDLIWAKEAQRYIDNDRSVLKTGIPKIGYEEYYTLTDGEKVWWQTSKIPLKDRAGKTIGILCTSEDITESKLVAKRLKESEEKFRSVFQNSPIGKSITGIDGSLEVNKSFCDILGYSVQELKSKKWQEITHPDDISKSTDVTQELLGGIKDRMQFEKRYIHKDGNIVWTDVVTALERDNDNKPEYFITSIQNITEKRISKHAIRENELRYKELVDTMSSGVAIYSVINDGKKGKDYIIQDFNKAALKLEGLEKNQVLGKSLFDIRPNIDDYGLIPIFEKVWKTKEPNFFPSKEYTDNKYSNYYENRVFCLPNGNIVALYDDVTKRENAVLLMKRNQERLDLALNATKDGIYDWNLISNEIYYSPPWKRMLGYKDDELPNDFSIWEKLTMPEDVERSWKMQQELISKQRDRFEMEFKMKHKDGHWVDVFSRAEAVFDDNGKAIRIVGTHVDISERRKAELALNVSEEKYKQLYESNQMPISIFEIETLRFLSVNNAFAEKYGYTKKEFLKMTFLDIRPESEIEKLKYTVNIDDNGLVNAGVYLHKKKNGEVIHVEIIRYDLVFEGKKAKLVFANDITERKKAEDEITKHREHLEEMVKERTKDLEDKNKELEKFNDLFVDREFRIKG